MAGVGFVDEAVLFSPNIPGQVNELLQAGVVATRTDKKRAEQLFKEANRLDPSCLYTYFALYKFYFYQARLFEAERCVVAGLEEAACQGGFPADCKSLYRGRRMWDLYASEAALFYLYTLKALAFIKLRQNQDALGRVILEMLKELDPEDRSGASVIIDLVDALHEE